MVTPEYLISIFLYLTYLVIFICAVVFYSELDVDKRRNAGYIVGIIFVGIAFIAFNIYFFYKLMLHLNQKKKKMDK